MTTREEKVRLSLEDDFTKGMIAAAGATALLKKELGGLSGTSVETSKSIGDTNREVSKSSPIFTQASKDIDRYSGRLRLLTEAAVVLGPALVPIGAVAVPAVVALAGGLAAAAASAGVAVLAFHGVGDALKALDAYQLDPTTAHFEKMRQEFDKIGPTGVKFVKFLDDLEPQLKDLQEVARQGIFPGVEEGITSLLDTLPQVRLIIFDLATELGRLASQAGDALSGDRFSAFFDYLQTDAAPTLDAFAHTIGNVVEGLGSLLVAFAPLSRDFSSGMEAMSKSFADWAANLSQTDGFQDFVAYVRESGPQVLDLLGALAKSFIEIAQAAAPVGAAVLPALTALANILGAIAASPIGPPLFTAVAAMLALNRATLLVNAGLARVTTSAEGAGMAVSGIGRGVVGITAVIGTANVLQHVFDKLADTSVDQGNLGRSLQALANGKTTDDLGNLFHTFQDVQNGWQADWNPISWISSWDPSGAESAEKSIKGIDEALARMVESGDSETAAKAFAHLGPEAKKAGLSVEQLKDLFPQYQTAVENSVPATDHAAVVARKLAESHNRQAASAEKATDGTEALVGAMEDEASAAMGAFDAVTQYNRALDAAQKQGKKSEAGINASTEAGRKNRDTLSGLAGAWNNQSNAVKNNIANYKQAKAAFVENAVAMGVNADKAKQLADKWYDVPKQWVTKYGSNALKGKAEADALAAAIRRIPQQWRTEYVINTTRTGTKPELHAPRADGGQIFGQRHPYGDKVLAMLAPGEEVISNRHGQADRFRADRASGRIPRYADGGMVGGAPTNFAAWQASQNRDPFAGLGAAAQQAGINLGAFNKIGLKELKQRDRFLNWQEKQAQKAESQAEKLLSVQRDRLDEERSQLKDLRDARQQFANQVKSNFKTDLFGNVDLAQAAQQGMLGSDFQNQVAAYAQSQMQPGQQYNQSDWVQQFLDTLGSSQIAALQVQANQSQLNQDTTNAGAFNYVLSQLRDMGLTGGAYRELAASGNLGQAQSLLQMTPADIAQLVKDYRDQKKTLDRLGGTQGNVEYGKQIAHQTRVVEQQARQTHRMADHVREMNAAIRDQTRLAHQLDNRIGVLTKLQRKREAERKKDAAEAAKLTGDAVGNVINNAVTHGQRRTP